MGVAAPKKPNRKVVSPRQVSNTLRPSIPRQTQPFETSYTFFSVTEIAVTTKAAPFLPTNGLLTLETPTRLSAPVLTATPSSSHSSAVALSIVFGVFFGTIIFSFILWRLCRRRSTPKSSASLWPVSPKSFTIIPVRYSSTMRYPQRPTPVRIKSGNRNERTAPSSDAEKTHATPKVVKVIQSDIHPPKSQRDSHSVSQKGHRRANSTPRLHPGRQAVVDVSSPTTETWDPHDIHGHQKSRHDYNPVDQSSVRDKSREDRHHLPPVIYVAGRAFHERSSRRPREREPQDQHHYSQTSQDRRRIRKSQPNIVNVVHGFVSPLQPASVSVPTVPISTSTRRYEPPRYNSPSVMMSTSGLSYNIGEESPSFTPSSSSSGSSEGGRSWIRRQSRSRSRSQSPNRVRFTLPKGMGQYLDDD